MTYRYAADTSGGTAYYKPLINIDNVDSINVNSLTYSNIDFGDVFGNVFVGDQAGANGTNRSNVNGFGEQALDYSDGVRNVNAMGFSVMNQADDLSNVVGIGTYLGSNMSNVSNSVFLGDFVAGELSNTSGEIFIGQRVAENLVASGGQNIVIGNQGLQTATSIGRGNVLLGAGVVGTGVTPGSSNVVIGTGSGANLTTDASANVILGASSGLNLVNGSNNILIGFEVDPPADTNDYLQIGNLIKGSQTVSYVSIMTNNVITGGITLGTNVNIYPVGSPFAVDVSGALRTSREVRSTDASNNNIAAIMKYDSGCNSAIFLAYNNSGGSTSNPPILFQQVTASGGTMDRMYIDSSGNVGINTVNPEANLDIVTQVSNASGWARNYLRMETGSGQSSAQYLVDTDNTGFGNLKNIYASYVYPEIAQTRGTSLLTQYSLISDGVISGLSAGDVVFPWTVSASTFVGNGTIPLGGIIMWSGSIVSIPAGWALCDGSSGTPDLRDRFVIGAGSTYAVGANGGSTTIEASNLPKHSHTIVDPGHFHSGTPGEPSTALNGGNNTTNNNNNTGTSTTGITLSQNGLILDSNNNPVTQTAYLQPYYSLAYIMRTA